MGSICRDILEEKTLEIIRDQIEDQKIVIGIKGGIPYLIKNDTETGVMIIDIDNLEDYHSSELTREIIEETAVSWM